MELSNADIVRRLREYAVVHRIGRMSPDVRVEKVLLSRAADLIEQLEMDLENTRRCLGDCRKELQDAEEDIRDWERTFDMLNDRENRHHYLEWWRKHYGESDLTYPDGDQIYKDFWRAMKIAHKMHLWIFHNTFDEQKVYDECGLTDEDNAMLGYGRMEFTIKREETAE